jgi:hypothetical protein
MQRNKLLDKAQALPGPAGANKYESFPIMLFLYDRGWKMYAISYAVRFILRP